MNVAATKVPFTETVELYCWDKRRCVQAAELGPQRLTLNAPEPLAEGSLVTLRLKLPAGRAFTVLGRVLSPEPSEEAPARIEIDFVDINPSDRACIAAFVGHGRNAA